MDFAHFAEHTGFEPFLHQANAFPAVALISHDGLHAVFFRGLLQGAYLPDVVRQRLLHKDMLPGLHGGHRGGEMGVVRGGDEDGIDLAAFLVQHLAEVGELGDVRIFLGLFKGAAAAEIAPVHIAEGHDLFIAGGLHRAASHIADADAGHADFLLRVSGTQNVGPGEGTQGGSLEEMAAGKCRHHLLTAIRLSDCIEL